MALVLVDEDGSVVAGANTYVDVDYVDNYCEAMGYTSWADATEVNKNSAIYRSMQLFETFRYQGTKTDYTNPLSFPRKDIYLETGDEFPNDEIPEDLKKAVSEGAYLELSSAGSLFVSGGDTKKVKRKKIDVLETEYFEGKGSSIPYPKLKNMIRSYIASSSEVVRS